MNAARHPSTPENPVRCSKRQAVLLAFVILMVMCGTTASAADTAQTPNFVIILADDMGYGDAGCYGGTAYPTPSIDRLASEGLRFTDFHSSGSVCSPTRAGLLTGRYQQRAGVPGVIYADPQQNRHHGLQTSEITFAELLRQAGYRTGITGKWHLGYEPQFNPVHHGFDMFRGYVSGNIDYITHCDRMGIADWWDGTQLIEEQGYSTHLITQHAIQFLERNRDQPFCLYVAHECPHSPYQGPQDPPVRKVGHGDLRGAGRKDIAAAYAEMMTEMDRGIGDIIDALRRLKLAENTLVFFFSDNGGTPRGSNGELRGAKGSLWEGGHRVPAIAWWPGQIETGTQTDATCISLDVMPTLLDLAQVAVPEGHRLDGISLVPVLTEKEKLPPRTLFWEYGNRSAVRQGDWKLLLGQEGRRSVGLYNLAEDVAEAEDLAEVHHEKVDELRRTLNRWKIDVTTGATEQPTRSQTSE